jgi:hypothetical protein
MRKGDEEFERQLAMAMASTAAEAESRAAAAAIGSTPLTSSASGHLHSLSNNSNAAARPPSGQNPSSSRVNPKPSAKPRASGPGALADLIHKGASPAVLKAAAQQAAAATQKGWLWAPNPSGLGSVPRVWSEVYIGSSASGRWLHVDGQLGCWDQPGVVEAATARQQPLTYVVACQAGAPKDVMSRCVAGRIMFNLCINLPCFWFSFDNDASKWKPEVELQSHAVVDVMQSHVYCIKGADSIYERTGQGRRALPDCRDYCHRTPAETMRARS